MRAIEGLIDLARRSHAVCYVYYKVLTSNESAVAGLPLCTPGRVLLCKSGSWGSRTPQGLAEPALGDDFFVCGKAYAIGEGGGAVTADLRKALVGEFDYGVASFFMELGYREALEP
jgi:hypothetical protein